MGWRGKWQPTKVFLPGESHGQKILVDLHESMGSQRISQDQAIKPKQNSKPGKMQESELAEITPFVCVSAIEPVSCVSPPELPWGSW